MGRMSEPETGLREEMGLREQKKQLTRESIADAALQLTIEKGLANVTTDDIARGAFVSPRTVTNYFSCKEEAVVAAGSDNADALLQQFAEAPEGEPPSRVLRSLLTAFVSTGTPEQLERSVQQITLLQDNPSLRPFQLAHYDQLEDALRSSIAERTGTDLDTALYPWLLAAAVISAAKAAMRLCARSGGGIERLTELIDAAFDQIDRGLLTPATDRAHPKGASAPSTVVPRRRSAD